MEVKLRIGFEGAEIRAKKNRGSFAIDVAYNSVESMKKVFPYQANERLKRLEINGDRAEPRY